MSRATVVKFSTYLLAATVCLSAVFAVWKWIELDRAANRILERYPDQIEALTQFVIDRPSFDVQDEQWKAEEAARQRLAMEFTDDAFADVSISNDGHHGIESVKQRQDAGEDRPWGYCTLFSVQGKHPSHRVSFGWSSAGEKFYVYDAEVTEAQYVRHFTFWIPRSSLD